MISGKNSVRKQILTKLTAMAAAAVLSVQAIGAGTLVFAADTAAAEQAAVEAQFELYKYEDPERFRVVDDLATAIPTSIAGVTHNARFADAEKRLGVDVSKYQSTIDWSKAAADGLDFAIVRMGYRGYGASGTLVTDPKFRTNIEGAAAAGLDVGAYFFTQAITVAEAVEEANFLLKALDGFPLTLPVYIDMEDITYASGRMDNAKLTIATRTAIAEAFCSTIEAAGYKAGVYASKSYLLNKLDPDALSQKHYIWLAHYITATNYTGDYDTWQFSDRGTIAGIPGKVDLDVRYVFPDGQAPTEPVTDLVTDLVTEPVEEPSTEPVEEPSEPIVTTTAPVMTDAAEAPTEPVEEPTETIVTTTRPQLTATKPTETTTVAPTEGSLLDVPVDFGDEEATLSIGDTVKFFMIGSGDITYTSSDKNVATVDENGNVTALRKGVTTITAASSNGTSDTIEITVSMPIHVALNYSALIFSGAGDTALLSTEDGTTIKLTSTDEKVVTVSDDGTVEAVGQGAASVIATDSEGNTAVCSVIVCEQLKPGDTNGDGVANAIDASEILIYTTAQALGKAAVLSETQMAVYDYNGDGEINAIDASLLLADSTTNAVR